MRILQVLPALNSGGVERGTVEFASGLVRRGHESLVLSSGGSMVSQLEAAGAHHIQLPVHRKSLASFGQIRPLRQILARVRPDIIHVRSRMPAWITRLALRPLPPDKRPALVSTFHGMYSINAYSAVMARADHVIAVSHCVRDYVLNHYKVDPERLTVIPRGVDMDSFQRRQPDQAWQETLLRQYPELVGKAIIMMPGRLSRWKGQLQFLEAMALIKQTRPNCHGIVVGGAEPGKQHFMTELKQRRHALGLGESVSFLGQRDDIANLYRLASLVCHMSTKPEPFGRTVTEALASGTPVVAFDRGGAAESLRACFQPGLVPPDDIEAFADTAVRLLGATDHDIRVPRRFWLETQTDSTLEIYQDVLDKVSPR